MKREYTPDEKENAIRLKNTGISINEISRITGVPASTLGAWITGRNCERNTAEINSRHIKHGAATVLWCQAHRCWVGVGGLKIYNEDNARKYAEKMNYEIARSTVKRAIA